MKDSIDELNDIIFSTAKKTADSIADEAIGTLKAIKYLIHTIIIITLLITVTSIGYLLFG